ncbi:uncharacterized protein DNG_09793 [Cephalotrichum gorgonifer]|uniref:Uncharacterized protein n=1 Tax=Cephalotrichum gorgonifer TaxID=2041049 RepID=A0AAE8N7V4_9PEZI|nr:uncharacterized protein DNG_09793 [Cephalotrichum gorgonifer]
MPAAPADGVPGVRVSIATINEDLIALHESLEEVKQRLARCELEQAQEIAKASLEENRAVEQALDAAKDAAEAARGARETMAAVNAQEVERRMEIATEVEEMSRNLEVGIDAKMEERYGNFEERMVARIDTAIDKSLELRWAAADELIRSEIQKARIEVEAAEKIRIQAELSRADEHRRRRDEELAEMEQEIRTKLERERMEEKRREESATRRVEEISRQARNDLLREIAERDKRAMRAKQEKEELRTEIKAEIEAEIRAGRGRKGRRQRPRPGFNSSSFHDSYQRRPSAGPGSRSSRFSKKQIPTSVWQQPPPAPDPPNLDAECISEGPSLDGNAFIFVDGGRHSRTPTSETERETTIRRNSRFHAGHSGDDSGDDYSGDSGDDFSDDSGDDRRNDYHQDPAEANGIRHGYDGGRDYGAGYHYEESGEGLEHGDRDQESLIPQTTDPFAYETTRVSREDLREGIPLDSVIVLRRYLQVHSPGTEPRERLAVEILSQEGAQYDRVAGKPMQSLYIREEGPPLQYSQPDGAHRNTRGRRQRRRHRPRSRQPQSTNAEEILAVCSEDDTFEDAQPVLDDTGTFDDAVGTTHPKLLTKHGEEEKNPGGEDNERQPQQPENRGETSGLGEGLAHDRVSRSESAARTKEEESDLTVQTPASSLDSEVPSRTHTPSERKAGTAPATADSVSKRYRDLPAARSSHGRGQSPSRLIFRSQLQSPKQAA